MSKVLKWGVYIGAGIIAILFLLVFYVSSKVKSELEHNLNGYVHYFNEQYTDVLSHMDEEREAEVKLSSFVCSGLVSYDCKASLEVILDKQAQTSFKLKEFSLNFSDIRTNSMKIKLRGVIDSQNLGAGFELMPEVFELSSIFKIINRQSGEIENSSLLRVDGEVLRADIEAKYRMRDTSLANKNIIKVIQTILAENGGLINLDLEYMIKKITLRLEGGDIKEVLLNMPGAPQDALEYDKKVDSMVWFFSGMLPSFGFKDSANLAALQNISLELAKFLKSQNDNFLFTLEAKDEAWGRLSDFSEIDLRRFIQDLDGHFIFKARE